MSVFQEEFLRCTMCGSKEFVEDATLEISVYAKNKLRTEDGPLPMEVLDKKIKYVCKKCGTILDV